MGQAASNERPPPGPHVSVEANSSRNYETLDDGQRPDRQEMEGLLGERDRSRWSGLRGRTNSTRGGSVRARQSEHHSTYRRETRARSTLIGGELGGGDPEAHGVVLEQEERPLILRDMEVQVSNGPITDIQAEPMPRRTSVIHRLGARVVPRHIRNWHVGRQANREPVAGRRASSDLSAAQPSQQATVTRRNRFSMFDFPTRPQVTPQQHDQSNGISAVNSYTAAEIPSDPEVLDPTTMPSTSRPLSQPQTQSQPQPHITPTWERRGRGGRLRRTLTGPIEEFFAPSRTRLQRNRNSSYIPRQLGQDDTTTLISPQGTGNASTVDQAPGSTAAELPEEGTEANPIELESPDRPSSWFSTSRDSAPTTDSRRSSRRMHNHLLGGRSSRMIRREDDTPLSRVLQLAAAAIAAQLSGSTDNSPDLQSVGDDHFDGNLNAFIQSLNTATEQSVNEEQDSSISNLPPLNFWRVFRFVNNRDNRSDTHQSLSNADGNGTGNRLVTLVVVGVRSVSSSSLLGETAGTLNTNLDGLLALPPSPPEGLAFGQGLQSQPASTRNRLQRRRTSLTSANPFPSQYESQRHQGTPGTRLSRTTALNPLRRSSTTSQSGAHQARPPSPFPDTARLSRHSSSRETVDFTPASSSRDTPQPLQGNPTSSRGDDPSTSSIRQRRRSESHGHLGSGAARRNGVVEPDGASSNGRHWLIYVVGTNLAEDHPAFQAPSLFTDNPSYEDMLMLSALLGPVKPPVANAQDVAAASGVFRLEIRRPDGVWTARAMDREPGMDGVVSPLIELSRDVIKCLVCQEDYDYGEEIRQLQSCKHVYHKECVDTWLTTGRNSCPMCRGPGVEEKGHGEGPSDSGVASEP